MTLSSQLDGLLLPHADVANFGPYLSMEADQSIYMLFVLLLSSELWCR